MSKITIIGAGFGGLTAIRTLRKQLPDADITLIAPKAEFVYYPSLIWIPSGLRQGNDLRIPLSSFLTRQKVKFHQGRVIGLKDSGRTVITDTGEISNDALIIASGGRGIKKLPGIEHSIAICDGIAAAESIRDKLAALDGGTIALGFGGNPQEPTAVRGGPMFELLFGLDTLLKRLGKRDKFELVFFNPSEAPGNRLGSKAVAGLLGAMRQRNIRTHLGHKITGFTADKVQTEGGDIAADLILFMPGMTGPEWLGNSGLPVSAGGFIQSDRTCQVADHPGVFVIGDSGSYANTADWLPKQGHAADLQAVTASTNLIAYLNGKPVTQLFKEELICIVDTLDAGIMVFRNHQRALVIPSRFWHYAKRLFEWRYLLSYR
jgi:sulfide:quinone oxidoreductase